MPTRSPDLSDFWKGVPLRGRVLFYAAVFFTFGIMGFVTDLIGGARSGPGFLATLVAYSGCFAIAIAWAAVNRNWWVMAAAVAVGVIVPRYLGELAPAAGAAPTASRLTVSAMGIAAHAVLGYLFFVSFISVEGKRYLRAHGELAIATDVHRSVVPEIAVRADGWEWWGRSEPSGDVGGDLVDVVETPAGRAGYVVDVAGHGVGAGVLMAMAKSAARAHLRNQRSAAALLDAWNDTLAGLFAPNRFATCACAVAAPGGRVDLGLAGHVPALLVRAADGAVDEHGATDPPLGILPGRAFSSRSFSMEPGDVLVLLTDGLTEAASHRDEQFGLGAIRGILIRERALPLAEIFGAVRNAALRHGSQRDDQTMLLLRRLG